MKRHFMAVLIVVSLVPIAIYWWNFRNYGLSDDPADWGVFGD